MSKCPYTVFMSFIGKFRPTDKDSRKAQHLRVTVEKNHIRVVDVALPAGSARWLIELIPDDIIAKIRSEGIPIENIQSELAAREELFAEPIFRLQEPHRTVDVWLE